MKKVYPPSELIINEDGSAFHLHLRPEQLADRIILVGDPGRVSTVATHFSEQECEVSSREFHSITGTYQGKRITVLSTGIGCDNIDIVMNELDALANIDFDTRTEKDTHRTLTIVRIGTCGGLQPFTPTGTFIASVKSIGFDGLLNYYEGRNEVCDLELEEAFKQHMDWSPLKGSPYVAQADPELIDQIAQDDMVRGITIACGGFYGPQGRQIRLRIQDPDQNAKIEAFEYPSRPLCRNHVAAPSPSSSALRSSVFPNPTPPSPLRICNFEMESSALAGLSSLLSHRAMTCCMVIANRYTTEMNTNYKNSIDTLIQKVLDRI